MNQAMFATRNLRGGAAKLACLAAALAMPLQPAFGFCGFYVAQADARLFNRSSKVVLAWDAGRTSSVTMASDYTGDPKAFALVVPVPTVVAKNDIRVVDPALVDKLDAYSAPRLTEYFDRDPCAPPEVVAMMSGTGALPAPGMRHNAEKDLGVKIEARYEVGVYDILILSAKDSGGLTTWLTRNDYRIPPGAGGVLGSYIRQGMHFFVAKVNLERQKLGGNGYLRPLQVSYKTNKFMLPVRLGTVNADGPQDLIVFALSRKGRVETTNYQTAKMPSGMAVPLFSKGEFGAIYKAAFDRRVTADGMSKVYMEYAWDMRGYMPCDPCAAPVPTAADLFALGARWHYPGFAAASVDELKTVRLPPSEPNAFLTRLHVRYDADHFPEDLMFTETGDRESFQAIYKLTHPALSGSCSAGREYRRALPARFGEEASNLARLTGWNVTSIRNKMEASGQSFTQPE